VNVSAKWPLMNRPASWSALGRLAGWALLTPACFLFAPAGARAACGDHVFTSPPAAEVAPSPAGHASDELPVPGLPQHKPCSGPHCSRAPGAPASPAPTPPPAAAEWGCLLGGLALPSPSPTAPLGEKHRERSPRLPRAIFHPPRLAS
jgi:hypothetical protein